MAMEPYKVSIIIPVYNVKKYLLRCLDSVANQSYRDLEVILVDDGSTDGSGEMCEEYASRDTRFQVIRQENRGQAAARNHAAKRATGEFIAFVDSDDYACGDYVEYLVRLQQKYNTDVVIARGGYAYEDRTLPNYPKEDADFLLTAEETLIKLNYNIGMGAMPWAKLFRRNLILSNPFPEGRIYEDLATNVIDCTKWTTKV